VQRMSEFQSTVSSLTCRSKDNCLQHKSLTQRMVLSEVLNLQQRKHVILCLCYLGTFLDNNCDNLKIYTIGQHWVHKTKTNKAKNTTQYGHYYTQTNTHNVNKI